MPETSIVDQAESARYALEVDGVPAGFVTYRLEPGRISFLHAEIEPALEGQGLGSRLIEYALDDARARRLQVLPHCPFVKSYIDRHHGYLELVPESSRARFGL